MKINQTENKLEITTNGMPQAIAGTTVAVIGIILAIVILSGAGGIKDQSRLISASIGLLFLIVGGVIAILAKNRHIILQKGGSSTATVKKILIGKIKTDTFDTSRVVSVCLYTYAMNNGKGSRQRKSTLSLLLDDNSLVEISSKNDSNFSVGGINVSGLIAKAPFSKEAEQISAYLGVPLKMSNSFDPLGSLKSVADIFHHSNDTVANQPVQYPVSSAQQSDYFNTTTDNSSNANKVLPSANQQPSPDDKTGQNWPYGPSSNSL